jgi:nitrogen regulatory protein PII 2
MSEELLEIVAVIRAERWKQTRQSIFEAGGAGVTQVRVLGRGQQSGLKYLSMLSTDAPQTVGYLPKRMVSCAVAAKNADAVVGAIIKANQTGNPGDGKIFVCPLDESIRIRTTEKGETSL